MVWIKTLQSPVVQQPIWKQKICIYRIPSNYGNHFSTRFGFLTTLWVTFYSLSAPGVGRPLFEAIKSQLLAFFCCSFPKTKNPGTEKKPGYFEDHPCYTKQVHLTLWLEGLKWFLGTAIWVSGSFQSLTTFRWAPDPVISGDISPVSTDL